ncbi:MBL fold metallo-hydrolase [Musicola paradisiaca]|uniref:Beta-lactamase superfamily hydrolase n=1 Tax=Musicola paradisiaca (strain Ech703) TaxID=579405 RepID=C6CD65_MUSP7|nr:MBL fold metallo-hydrolase [Musicola paradisiaca]ACS86936.1 beta-lactamase superfamily hydrolase [Musicola paradisiaca Ech703]
MELDILGSGEAYDRRRVNAAIRVTEAGFSLLIDCGPTVPPALWQRRLTADDIDAVYFTHCHPDHALGLTTWLNWCESCGRTAPLRIIAPRRQRPQLQQLADFAFWPTAKPLFPIDWLESETLTQLGPWQCRTAATRHSVPNRALWLRGRQGSLFYSGDGQLTPEAAALMAQADLALVECFSLSEDPNPYHGNWPLTQTLSRKAGALLGLYHIEQSQRAAFKPAIATAPDVFLAEQGDRAYCLVGQWHRQPGNWHE